MNALAEGSPGFVWRLKEENGNATAIKFHEDNRIIVNMSVWKDIDSLMTFVYKSHHREVLMQKKEWFENLKDYHAGLWYVPLNSYPTIDEARSMLAHLSKNGPTPLCFTFAKRFSISDFVQYLEQKG